MGAVVKTKYNIGDKVWYISGNEVQALDVTGVRIHIDSNGEHKVEYFLHYGNEIEESKLYKSKKELLESL